MNVNLLKLESDLNYDYQRVVFRRILENFDIENEHCLNDIHKLSYNLLVVDYGKFERLKVITDLFVLSEIKTKQGVLWAFIQSILLLKVLCCNRNMERLEVLNFIIYGNDNLESVLIEKRLSKIENGFLVDKAKIQFLQESKNKINQYYYWGISLLVKQVQRDIYLSRNNLDLLNLNQDTLDNISNMKSILSTISSLDSD